MLRVDINDELDREEAVQALILRLSTTLQLTAFTSGNLYPFMAHRYKNLETDATTQENNEENDLADDGIYISRLITPLKKSEVTHKYQSI